MKYEKQIEAMIENIKSDISKKVKTHGKESKHRHEQVILIKPDDLQFNVGGDRYLTEVGKEKLYDNDGYEYNFSAIEITELAPLADYINSL